MLRSRSRSSLGLGRAAPAALLSRRGSFGGEEVVARDEAKLSLRIEAAEVDGEERFVARVESGEVVGDVLGDGAAAQAARVLQLRQRLHNHLRGASIQPNPSIENSRWSSDKPIFQSKEPRKETGSGKDGSRKLTSL